MQPSRACAMTESMGASADTHHAFRPASRVPRRAPDTLVHGDALRPRVAAILTRPDALVLSGRIYWLSKRGKWRLIRGSEGTRPIYHWKADDLGFPFIHFLDT